MLSAEINTGKKVPTPDDSSNKGIKEVPFPAGTVVRTYAGVGLRVERIEERARYERIGPD